MTDNVVFLIDIDNTLLDNDYLLADLRRYIEREIGAGAARYWAIFNVLRSELGYVDYLAALQRYRVELELGSEPGKIEGAVNPQQLARIASFLIDYPFAARLYARALEVLEHLSSFGKCVILSDGDMVLQPRKIERAGIYDAVRGRVLVYLHKEQMLNAVARHYPAQHYVLIDDKPSILAAVKAKWQSRVTTVLPLQGHYALDFESRKNYPAPEFVIDDIGALVDFDVLDFDLPITFKKTVKTIEHTV